MDRVYKYTVLYSERRKIERLEAPHRQFQRCACRTLWRTRCIRPWINWKLHKMPAERFPRNSHNFIYAWNSLYDAAPYRRYCYRVAHFTESFVCAYLRYENWTENFHCCRLWWQRNYCENNESNFISNERWTMKYHHRILEPDSVALFTLSTIFSAIFHSLSFNSNSKLILFSEFQPPIMSLHTNTISLNLLIRRTNGKNSSETKLRRIESTDTRSIVQTE